MTTDLLQHACRLSREGVPFVMATVVAVQGRTPRDVGAKMIWLPGDRAAGGANGEARGEGSNVPAGPRIIGTVGGGKMEHLLIEACERRFAERSSGIERFSLLQDADQCCGGSMEVFVEYVGPRGRVVIFGAGHVAMEVARLAREGGLAVTVVDDRAEWNTPARFPACGRVASWAEGLAVLALAPAETMACVMTYDHDRDFELVRAILSERDDSALPAYVGLIGSRSKRACFFGRLSASGVPAERIERVECPMGLGDMGKAPIQVAVSIAGRLLLSARAMEARATASPERRA